MKGETPHSNWSIRCISVPGEDTDLALYVSFEKTRFLFGCGQGTQRAFVQKRLSMRGLSAVFLPEGMEAGRGGLAGVIMTAADAGIKQMSVVGPPDTSHYIATLRSAVQRDHISIDPISFPLDALGTEPREVLVNPNLTVQAIALRPDSDDRTSTPLPLSPSTSQTFGDALPFNPLSSSFRPSSFGPSHLRTWTETVVGDMFGKRMRVPPELAPRNQHPLITGDGVIRFARPDTRYALPQARDKDVLTEMVYICQAPDVRGKFDVAKANALGLPSGPVRGKITRGESVEVDDPSVEGGKRVIRPEDCLVGGGPGAILIIVNCTDGNLDQLLSAEHFKQYHVKAGEDQKRVHVVVHRVTRTVWESPAYQAWTEAFGPDTHHLLAQTMDHSAREAFFRSATWNATQLSLLDPTIFPVPYSDANPDPPSLPANCQIMAPNLEVRMHPPAAPALSPPHAKDRPFPTNTSELNWAKDVLAEESPEYAQACEAARQAVQADPRASKSNSGPGHDVTVTTLGTGSAIPSKYRNVSSTHLDIPGVGGILLDCGEGSLGQLRRRFGPEGSRRVLEELRMIYISHMHADHHLGLQAILREKVKLGRSEPFFVVGPLSIGLSLYETRSWQQGIDQATLDSVIFLDNMRFGQKPASSSPPGSPRSRQGTRLPVSGWPSVDIFACGSEGIARHQDGVKALVEALGLKHIATPVVEHRGRAYGLVLEHQSGWKIVYSGDTKPCQALVTAGKDATLLVHEATLEDDKPEVAAQKGHSTFSQAIDIGKEMNASHILLNHFSQRYPKLPKLNLPADASSSEAVISISFDFMSIKVGDMWKMAHYMDAISLLFDEAEPEDGDDTMDAVEHDLNPSIDNAGNGKKGKGKHNGQSGQKPPTNNNKAQNTPNGSSQTISKRAQKRAERKAEIEAREEAEQNAQPGRQTSPPSGVPDAKRPRREIVVERPANTA